MGLGICNLSIVPVRISDSDKSEMITQLVYGDLFTIVEEKAVSYTHLTLPTT